MKPNMTGELCARCGFTREDGYHKARDRGDGRSDFSPSLHRFVPPEEDGP